MGQVDLSSFSVLNPRFESESGLLVLDLDHGKANEMGSAQLAAFSSMCELVESNSTIRCVLTTSARHSKRGTPIFIAGANVTERTEWDDDRVRAHVQEQRALMVRIRRLPVFTVALSHGVTLGWGVEFLLTADTTLATPAATFALPETGLGIIPGARGTADLASTIGVVEAMRMGCLGEHLAADEAARIGLVQELVPNLEEGLDRARVISLALARRSPTAIARFKRALLDGIGQPAEVRLQLESEAYEYCVSSGEAAVGRSAFSQIRRGETPSWGERSV
jgi:enoyl-CoA hydratase/carnithine racemase